MGEMMVSKRAGGMEWRWVALMAMLWGNKLVLHKEIVMAERLGAH